MRTESRPPRRRVPGLRIVATLSAVTVAWPSAASGHVDSFLLPEDCGSCHVGHGLRGQPMLDHAEEGLCFRCHGSEEARTREIAEGRLAPGGDLKDLETEFRKPYRHPVVEGVGHSPTERLDGARLKEVRHAECVDCHNPHQRLTGTAPLTREVSGLTISGQILEKSLFEYELCLKCHGDSPVTGRPAPSLREEFLPSGQSQHPVIREPSGRAQPSLLQKAVGRRMLCSDCHGNDDPTGPKGPHGSRHEFLLIGNYDQDVHAEESSYAYQLCYGCHDRQSILSDESFPFHSLHILGDVSTRRTGTSCHTCHTSHGAPDAPHLIHFNPQAVDPESTTRRLEYRPLGQRAGECYLSCHGYDHAPGEYR